MKDTMIGYINDQGSIFRYCLDQIDDLKSIAKKLSLINYRKIYVVGSGSSYHAGVIIKYYLQKYLKVDTQYIMPNLFTYHELVNPRHLHDNSQILVIGISQSGNSLSTLSALTKAKKLGFSTLAITEDLESRICKEGYPVLQLLCGKENVSPETKGYTCTVFMGYLFSIYMAYYQNLITDSELSKLLVDATEFSEYFENFLNEANEWYKKNKDELLRAAKIGITGYGLNYGTAIEAQLKLYECTHIPTVGYESEEFIHGHIFAYDEDNYIFAIGSSGQEFNRLFRMVDFYKKNVTKHVFVISSRKFDSSDDRDLIFSKYYSDDLMAIANVVPFQLMAYYIATDRAMTTQHFPMVSLDWPARDKEVE